MATTSSTSTKTSAAAHKHADLEKEIAALRSDIATLTKRVGAAEAKASQAGSSSAPTGDFVTQRQWKTLLQKLSGYIGFNLQAR